MQYTIVVDKQSSNNPSKEKKEYTIDIEELRTYKGISDTIKVTQDMAYVIRRLSLSQYGVLSILNEPIQTELKDLNIELFEGDNYIYILNGQGNKISASYTIKSDFTDTYPTKAEMKAEINASATEIQLIVSKKLDKEEFATYLEVNAEAVQIAWNKISQFLKMEGIEGKATLNIYDKNNSMLMSLSQDGQCFYDSMGNKIGTVGVVREENKDTLAFAMNVDWDSVSESKSMAWGFYDTNGYFMPVFYLNAYYGAENSEYGGEFIVEGNLSTETLKVIKDTIITGGVGVNIVNANGNVIFSADTATPFFNLANLIFSYISDEGKTCIDFSDCVLTNMKNVPQTDENLNYISGSANSHIFASFKDGGSVIIFENSSDRNLKKNIKDSTESALDKIMKIKHRQFNWKKDNKHQNIGYIAQELIEVDENFVHHMKYKDKDGVEKENWQINDLSVLSTTTKAIQEQQKIIEQLKGTIKQQQEIVEQLKKDIQELKEAKNE